MFNLTEYLLPDYCLSCAYFKSTKGHYGTCLEFGPKVPYDGSKKGSACMGWRVKSKWIHRHFKLQDQQMIKKQLVRAKDAIWQKEKLGSKVPITLGAVRRLDKAGLISTGHGKESVRSQKQKDETSRTTIIGMKNHNSNLTSDCDCRYHRKIRQTFQIEAKSIHQVITARC